MGHLFFAATSACQPNVLALAKACTGGYVDGTNDLHTTYKVPSLVVTTFNEIIDSGALDPTLLPSILLHVHPAPCTLYHTYTLHLPCLGLGPLWGGRTTYCEALSSLPLAALLHLHLLHVHLSSTCASSTCTTPRMNLPSTCTTDTDGDPPTQRASLRLPP